MSVHYQLDGEVSIITLSRPERFNAVSADLSNGLIAALRRAGEESRAVVITGAGKAFCAGADLSDLIADYEQSGPDLTRVIGERFNPLARALIDTRVPTIAAVNGVAAGAGMGMALACDFRMLSSDSFFLSAFIGLGLIPDTGSTWLLVHHLGLGRAIEFTASNRRLSANEAEVLGLGRMTKAEDVLESAVSLGRTLAAGPTAAYVANRQILYRAAATNFDSALEAERDLQGQLGNTALHLEGMKAFLEKRTPNFRA